MTEPNSTGDLFGEQEAPTQITDRLFFGLFPDAKTAERICALGETLKRDHGLKSRLHALDRLHVTLFHLGDYPGLPPALVRGAIEAGEAVEAVPFEVTFDRAGSFAARPGSRPFVLRGGEGLEALMVFRQALGTALAHAGLGRLTTRAFTPHVTLLYGDPAVAEAPVPPVSWTVRELVLVNSRLGKSEYVPLGRWPLRG